jgi:hypothetical protein
MVVEGEEVVASLTTTSPTAARIEARKSDGTPVLEGTATIGADDDTELDTRLARTGDPGELFIVDQIEVGQRVAAPAPVSVDLDTPNGDLYPFSLRQKLDAITEPSPWYEESDNPWGDPIVPIEMVSVLAAKAGGGFPVRGPSVGLFLDLEIRLVEGPVRVDRPYRVEREVVGLGQSRRTESHWVRSHLIDDTTGAVTAVVLLHSGVFKESYAAYPADRL